MEVWRGERERQSYIIAPKITSTSSTHAIARINGISDTSIHS
jgi:hypothetical protein